MMREHWRGIDGFYQSRQLNNSWINWETAKTAAIYAGMGVIAIGAIGLTVNNWDVVSNGIIGGMKAVGNAIGVTATYSGQIWGTAYGYIHTGASYTYSAISSGIHTLGSWIWSRPTTATTQSVQTVADIVSNSTTTQASANMAEITNTIRDNVSSSLSTPSSVRANLERLAGLTPPTGIENTELTGLIPNTVATHPVSPTTRAIVDLAEGSIAAPQPIRPASLPNMIHSFSPGNVGLSRTNTPLANPIGTLYTHLDRLASHTGLNSPTHAGWQELLDGSHSIGDGHNTPSTGEMSSPTPSVTITTPSTPTPRAVGNPIDSSLLVPLPPSPADDSSDLGLSSLFDNMH